MKNGYRLRVHPAGAALLVMAFLFLDSHVVLAALLALLWHEGAHLLMMALTGVKRCTVELTPFGGMADAACFDALAPWKQAFIALSGVAASVLAAWVCLRFLPNTPFSHALFNTNASLALLNCLPVWPLDGARAVMALALALGLQRAARKLMLWLAYLLAVCMIALGLYGAWHGHFNLSLLLMGPYLCYAANASQLPYTVRCMQGASVLEKKLNGEALPVQAFACAQTPSRAEALRLLMRLHPMRFHTLMVIDPETGAIQDCLTEQQLAREVFNEHKSGELPWIGCTKA